MSPISPVAELYPHPRHIRTESGPTLLVDQLPVTVAIDEHLPVQGYRLQVRATDVVLAHRDAAGRRYGEATLDQLRATGPIGPMEIEDWPDICVRGFLLDVSRDRVPRRRTLGRLVEVLAQARYNQLQLYTEHTFTYAKHETVWQDASPLTPADIAWLDRRCAEVGIELVPNQAVFGHMDRWLRHDAYRDRAELPTGFEIIPGLTIPAMCLAPTEENARFALDLLHQLLPNFRSRRVNINCDEAFELGQGTSRAEVEFRGKGAVFLDHVMRIAQPLLDDGYEVQLWGDMLGRQVDLVNGLPGGMVPIAWHYEGPGAVDPGRLPAELVSIFDRLGMDLGSAGDGFAPHVAPFDEAGVPCWVAPGTSSWNSLIGRADNAASNILDAADTALRCGSGGVLLTDWGDNGHLQPMAVSLPAIVLAGAVSWCAVANRDLDVAGTLDRLVFEDPDQRLGDALQRLGRLWCRTGQTVLNGSPLHAGLFPGQFLIATGDPDRALVGEVVDELDELIDVVAASRPLASDGDDTVAELHAAARLARHGAWNLLERAGGTVPDPGRRRADLADAVESQRAAWLARSRPGGLTDSLAPLVAQLAQDEGTGLAGKVSP